MPFGVAIIRSGFEANFKYTSYEVAVDTLLQDTSTLPSINLARSRPGATSVDLPAGPSVEVGVAVGVTVRFGGPERPVDVAEGVAVEVGVLDAAGLGDEVFVALIVGVVVSVAVALLVTVGVLVAVDVAVLVGVVVGTWGDTVKVAVAVGVAVTVLVGVAVAVKVRVGVADCVGVRVAVGEGVGVFGDVPGPIPETMPLHEPLWPLHPTD